MADITIRKATLINFISKYSNVIIQLIINSILARLLTPDDFGIVAIVTIFINFFTMLSDMGIGPAIIQNKDLNKKEISDIYIFTFFVAGIFSVLFGIFSYPLSIFYNNKVYIGIGYILSICIFFNILNIVPNAILLKNKEFKSLGIRTVCINCIAGTITIYLSFIGFKYYALVINSVVISVLTYIFNVYMTKVKMHKDFNIKTLKKIMSFSTYQLGFNFVNYFSRNLDNLLIGKLLGQSALGYYDKAYKLMLYPIQNFTSIITPVLHPILSDYQDSKEKIYSSYVKIIKVLSLGGVFLSVFCYIASKEIILIMFGGNWIRSINSFTILSLSIWLQVVNSISGSIFQSTGEVKRLFKVGILNTFMTVIAVIAGILFKEIEYVAVCVLISFILSVIVSFYYIFFLTFNKNLKEICLIFYKDIIVYIITFFVAGSIFKYIYIENIFLSAALKFVLIIIIFIIALFVTGQFKDLNVGKIRNIKSKFKV